MAITNGYATLAELKARMGIPLADTADDSIMEAVIESASRMIDRFTGRFFYQTSTQIRYYNAASNILVFVDDAVSVDSVYTDRSLNRSWSHLVAASNWELGPLNNSPMGLPYTEIRMKYLAGDSFDLCLEGIKVTGVFGWAAIPDAINEACLITAARYFKRKDAVFGVAGGGEVGQSVAIRAVDPDAQVLLAPYRKIAVTELV